MGFFVARRAKRLWSDEEKRSICLQTAAPEVSVAQVARRYALNANLIFKWLRDARFRAFFPRWVSGQTKMACST
jgi:transposase